jgi:SAM-dependent methyltransferase
MAPDADRSEGWDAIAQEFLAVRSNAGASLVREWARKNLPQSGSIIDVGCGSGVPISEALIGEGFEVYGLDASSALIAAFRRRFPDAPSACEAAQESAFFDRTFDGAVSVGLLFLFSEDDQQKTIRRIAAALKPGGRLLFSAPRERCEWPDMLTGRPSRSLGEDAYAALLKASGLDLAGCCADEGGNNYYDAVKSVRQA